MNETQKADIDEINLLEIAATIKENLWLLLIGPAVAGMVALAASFLIPPTYTAKTQFLPPQQSSGGMAAAMFQSLGALGGLAGAAAGIKNPTDQYVSFLRSESVERGMVERFKLKEKYGATLTVDAIRSLEGNTKITAGKDGLIVIEVDDLDAKAAADLANGYLDELGKLLNRVAVTEAQQRRAFYESQLQKTRKQLIAAQTALQRSGIREGTLRAEPRAAAEAYAELKAQVTEAEVALTSMRGRLTDQSSEMRMARARLNALRQQLTKAETTDNSEVDDSYIANYRDFKYQESLFEIFAKQFELAKLDEAKEGASIQVVDVALPPERKSKPRKSVIASATTVITAFGLLIFVFARQAWRKTNQEKKH